MFSAFNQNSYVCFFWIYVIMFVSTLVGYNQQAWKSKGPTS